jgi:hypothetical protein
MKKIFALLLIMSISTTIAQGLDFGVKLGLNNTNVSGIEDFQQRQGLSAGLFAGMRLGDKFGLQLDALYSQQGAEVGNTYSEIVSDFDLDYISVPVVVKYYFTESLNIHAGPQLGILLNDETSVANQVVNNIGTNNVDWLGTIGIGLDLPLGLRAEARYSFGLTKVNDSLQIPSLEEIREGRTRMTTLSIGYTWL